MGNIHIRAAVVLKFIDSVWERPVSARGLNIQTKQHNKVIWKDNSCAVILERTGVDVLDILIDREIYQSIDLHFELQTVKLPISHTIWITPSEKYPFTPDMAVIKGKSLIKEFCAIRIAESFPFKLMEDIDAGKDKIRLWGIGEAFEERQFLLREDNQEEIITITESDRDNSDDKYSYYTKKHIVNTFHKDKARLYPVTGIVTDNNGNYVMAFRRVAKNGEKIELVYGNNQKKQIEIKEGSEFIVNI